MHKTLLLALATSTCNKASAHTEDGTDIYVQQCFSSEGSWFHVWVFRQERPPLEYDLTVNEFFVFKNFKASPDKAMWDSM